MTRPFSLPGFALGKSTPTPWQNNDMVLLKGVGLPPLFCFCVGLCWPLLLCLNRRGSGGHDVRSGGFCEIHFWTLLVVVLWMLLMLLLHSSKSPKVTPFFHRVGESSCFPKVFSKNNCSIFKVVSAHPKPSQTHPPSGGRFGMVWGVPRPL